MYIYINLNIAIVVLIKVMIMIEPISFIEKQNKIKINDHYYHYRCLTFYSLIL